MNLYNRKTVLALMVLLVILALSLAAVVWYSAYLLWSINAFCAVIVFFSGGAGINAFTKKHQTFLEGRIEAIKRIESGPTHHRGF